MKVKSLSILHLKFFFIAALFSTLLPAQNRDDEILMSIGDEQITLFEFTRLYLKNSEVGGVNEKLSLDDYLDLFIKFKSKVLEAEKLGLDTLPAFKEELAQYRNQLALPYLTDHTTLDRLTGEAYERMKSEINASHILIKCAPYASQEDTLKAYQKTLRVRERITTKKEAFDLVAKGTSDDPSAKFNSGNLGYFTVFQMAYPFETAAYNAVPGVVSQPVRSRYGYHLIRVTDKIKARGTVKVAHIMIAVPRGSSTETEKNLEEKAREIHQRVIDGESFADLAREYSDDYNSARNEGNLPWFGTGRMVPEFENAAFELQENGAVSEPVRTGFGWHIIKRVDKKELGSFEELKDEIRRKVLASDRAAKAKQVFIETLKNEYDYKIDSSALYPFFIAIDQTTFGNGSWKEKLNLPGNKTLFSFDRMRLSQENFLEYLTSQSGKSFQGSSKQFVTGLLRDYETKALLEFEKIQLPVKNRDFYYLLKEYHDGMLLFEVSDRMVWSKAIEDTAGLKEFYNIHKNNYLGESSIEIIRFDLKDPSLEKQVQKIIKKGKRRSNNPSYYMTAFAQDTSLIKVSSETYYKGDDEMVDRLTWKKGSVTTNDHSGGRVVILVIDVFDPRPRPLEEIRGIVTSDFQDALENQWHTELGEKYPVQLNQSIFDWLKLNLK